MEFPDLSLLRAIKKYQSALNEKSTRHSRPTVIRLPAGREPIQGIPTGSVAVFVGAHGSQALERVADIFRSRRYRAAGGLVERSAMGLVKLFARGKSPYASYSEVPVFGELRYSTKTLAHGFLIHGKRDLAVEVLPYTGGKLSTKEFRFVEYHSPEKKDRLGCVVVISPPVMTPLEREMVDQVPEDLAEMHISQSKAGYTLIVATLLIVALVATILVTYFVHTEMVGYKTDDPDDPDSLKASNPTASARSLLEQRLAILERVLRS